MTINKTRDLQDVAFKNKFTPKPCFPQKGNEAKPFQKEWTRKLKMDAETWKDPRKKKLCFSFQKPWALGHKCAGKDKVRKAQYIEVYTESDSDDGDEEY